MGTITTTAKAGYDMASNFMSLYLFATGFDGPFNQSSGTTTLTRNTYYSSITLTGTAKINLNGFDLYCSGNVDLTNATAGAIFNLISGGGAGAAGGTAGTAGTGQGADTQMTGSGQAGGAGGAGGTTTGTQAPAVGVWKFSAGGQSGAGAKGGNGTSGNGGASRSAVANTGAAATKRVQIPTPQASIAGVINSTGSPELIYGGAGGVGGSGGGGDGTAGAGGGGGGTGGFVSRCFFRTLTVGGSTPQAVINSAGANGGAGGTPAAGNRGGGGGGCGGGGGALDVVVGTLVGSATNALAADGGNGGAGGGGTGTGTGGDGGSGGWGGQVSFYNLSTGVLTYAVGSGSGIAGGAASGTTGGTAGTGEQTRVSL